MITERQAKTAANRIIALILREESQINLFTQAAIEAEIEQRMKTVVAYRDEQKLRSDIRDFEEIALAHPIEVLDDLGLINPQRMEIKRVFAIHLLFDHLGEMPGTNLFIRGIQHLPFAEKERIIKEIFKQDKGPSLYEILLAQPNLTALRERFYHLSRPTAEAPRGGIRAYMENFGGQERLLLEITRLRPELRHYIDAKRSAEHAKRTAEATVRKPTTPRPK